MIYLKSEYMNIDHNEKNTNPNIVQIDENPENVLRQTCTEVKKSEFGSPELLDIISKMKKEAIHDKDGVAIAAPQIGIVKRIFVIAKRAYKGDAKWRPEVFINPTITDSSKKHKVVHEGCLSVRGVYGCTERAMNVTVTAYDEYGNKFSYGAGGLIAHIIQHEYDHLDGILFIDHGFDFEEYDHNEGLK